MPPLFYHPLHLPSPLHKALPPRQAVYQASRATILTLLLLLLESPRALKSIVLGMGHLNNSRVNQTLATLSPSNLEIVLVLACATL